MNVVSCAGEVVIREVGEADENIPLIFSVQTLDDGSMNVFGQFIQTTFDHPQ
jgi:hypothetical protein